MEITLQVNATMRALFAAITLTATLTTISVLLLSTAQSLQEESTGSL